MAELSEIEKSISDLEKQIAYLEEQRPTLTFSSSEEEAEADRALADLKLRYADTVAAYRKSQASRSRQSVSSVKPPKKRDPVAIVFLVLGVLALVFFAFVFLVPAILGPVNGKTEEAVVRECVSMAEDYLPGQNAYEYDSEKHILTMFFWDSSFKNGGVSAKSGNKKAVEAWDSLSSVIVSLSAHMQQKFKDAGYGTSVAVCAVDPANHDQVFIMANNGRLLYDAVNG